ncbi:MULTISPECIES: hypothetical protein [Micrococcus]|uniref:Secreted protein n=4 Tax=Micrococcus lylae TaxID=1273 RepID=A0ABY2JXB1_9MICC|nr:MULTISPECIES: hypothetical protein [Micrococcus]TFH97975.1 hypothetical protein E4A49_10810 [Micrococcus lylae]
MRTRRRHATPLAGSALMLAAALTLTACQQADQDASASANPSDTDPAASPSEGAASGGDGTGGSEGSGDENGPGDAEISASAVPDHLLPPDGDKTRAMTRALEKTMGRPVASVKGGTVADHQRDSEQSLEILQNPNANPMVSEQCREDVVARAEVYAAATAQTTRFSGESPAAGGDGDTVSAPYLVEVDTFEGTAGAADYVEAMLTVADNQECVGEPVVATAVVATAGSGHEEHEWGEGTRYTFATDRGDGQGVYVGTVAVDGNRVISITDSTAPDEDPSAVLERHAEAVDALADVIGEPLRD